MRVDSALRTTLILQTAAAGFALAVAGPTTFLSGIIMILITIPAGMAKGVWPKDIKKRKILWNTLAFLVLMVFLVEIIMTRELLQSVVRLVVFLTGYKLFNLVTNRDYFTAFMLNFLQFLAAASISYDYRFSLPYLLYVVLTCIGLTLYAVKSGKEREYLTRGLIRGIVSIPEHSPFTKKQLLKGLAIAGTIIVLTALIFPLLPRMKTDVLGQTRGEDTQYISGFSPVVSINDIGDIKKSPKVIMRVTLNGGGEFASSQKLRIHGITLSSFDGQDWRADFSRSSSMYRDGNGDFYAAGEVEGEQIEQDIILAPINANVLFHIGELRRISGPFDTVFHDNRGSIFRSRNIRRRVRYEVSGILPDYSLQQLRGIQSPPLVAETREYLMLPRNMYFNREDLGRIRDLALEITRGSQDQLEKVGRIMRYLKTEFSYSLELSDYVPERNKMISFLFDKKKGHCAYFASAMVIMCRSIGVPARMINGFQMGQYNPVGDFYIIRAADAHSWVEIYFPAVGWVDFDPTPSSGQESEFANVEPEFFTSIIESIDMFWIQNVLAFDTNDQQELISTVVRAAQSVVGVINKVSDWILSFFPDLQRVSWLNALLHVLLALLIVIIALGVIWKFIIKPTLNYLSRKGLNANQTNISFFEKTLPLLRKAGYPASRCNTARDMAEATRETSFSETVNELMHHYEEARFSDDNERKAEAIKRGESSFRTLKRQIQEQLKKR